MAKKSTFLMIVWSLNSFYKSIVITNVFKFHDTQMNLKPIKVKQIWFVFAITCIYIHSLYFFCYLILFNYNLRKSEEYGSQIHGNDGVDCVDDGGPWGVGVQNGKVSTERVNWFYRWNQDKKNWLWFVLFKVRLGFNQRETS